MLLLTLLTILTCVYEIPAVSWEYVYEGNKLPDDPALGDNVWKVFKTDGIKSSDVCKITPDGEIHITDPADKVCFFMRDIDDPSHVTYEARLKVLSQSGPGFTVDFTLEDGAVQTSVYLYPDHIESAGISHNVDMTQYHILRMTRDGDKVSVYIDDKKVIDRPAGGDATSRKDFTFGAGSTGGAAEHYWDYVAFTTAGAFSPKELPNLFLSIQAVEGRDKLATRWATLKLQQ
ncbi:MAG: hypothetical protein AABZ06_02980 [Bdellovibrionota bacterium]